MEQKELKFYDFGVIVWVSAQSPLENVNIVWVWECQLRYRYSLSTFFKVRVLKKGAKHSATSIAKTTYGGDSRGRPWTPPSS